MIRTGADYLPAFHARVDALNTRLPLRVIVGDNDSVDNTPELLHQWQDEAPYSVAVIDRSEGGPHYPSIDHPDRWRHISHVMNGVLDLVENSDDKVMYVDPDLIWSPTMVERLLAKLGDGRDVIAPLACHAVTLRRFDTWGTRKNGERIRRIEDPFDRVPERGIVEVDSAACLNVMDAHWARVARFGEHANVSWHDQMREKGAHIWLDFDERVIHP
jgi:hypothetical protein